MNTTLQTLIQLQEVDATILTLQQKIGEFPAMCRRLDQQLRDHEAKLHELETRIEEQEKTRRMKELDVEARDEKIKKYQGQLLAVKNNKEYAALIAEINTLKSQNSLTEDDILELMESIDRAKNALADSRQDIETERKRVAEAKQHKEAEQQAFQRHLEIEQENRQQLAERIEENVLTEYTKLFTLRNGLAVTLVKDGGVCTGCHVALTPQMFAEVKSGEYVHRCPVCFRFLYWTENHLPQEQAQP